MGHYDEQREREDNNTVNYAHSPGYQQSGAGLGQMIPGSTMPGPVLIGKFIGKAPAIQTQVGGTHYTDMAIQPAAYNLANGLGWAEGDAISYISRWRNKGGLQDLRKARQTLLLLIEHEESIGTV